MSDSILNCVQYKDASGAISYYAVTFSFDGVVVADCSNPIYIGAAALANPSDLNEVKTVACKQASIIKALYSTANIITDLNGPVSL